MKIIKYGNRKLYQYGVGYLTLESVRKNIVEGKEISVLDHKTKKDVTNDVLKTICTKLKLDNTFLSNLIRITPKDV